MAPTARKKKDKLDNIDKIIAEATALSKHGQQQNVIPKEELRYFSAIFGWSPSSINDAIKSHESGYFNSSEKLYQAMRRHPRIEAANKTRMNFIRTLPFSISIPENCPPEIIEYNKFIEKNFDYIVSPNNLSEIIARTVWFGFCIARITWTMLDGRIIPRIKPFTHNYIQYNFGQNQYQIIDADNNIEFISENDPDWLFFKSEETRPWFGGILRAMGHVYAQTIHAIDRWMAFNDVEAGAIKVLHTPAEKREQIEAMIGANYAAELTSGDVFLEPDQYELRLLTSQGRGDAYKTFKDIIDKSDADAAILLLGHNLSQEVKGGSFAATTAAKSFSRELCVGDIANLYPICNVLKIALKRNFSSIYFANLEQDITKYAGMPVWGIDKVKDPELTAALATQNATAFSTFIASALSAGLKLENLNIDWRDQAEKCGISLNPEKNIEK